MAEAAASIQESERAWPTIGGVSLYLPSPLRPTRLDGNDISECHLQLRRVFDDKNPIIGGQEGGDRIEQCRLAGAGAATDQEV